MKHLNYFAPYESLSPNHEDQLTRAFLVVLRLIPLVQVAFLDLIREDQVARSSKEIIPTLSAVRSNMEIETQVAKIRQPTGTLVSVLLTNERWNPSESVKISSRRARYDGVIYFEPDWIVSIENKPWSENIWGEQLNPSCSSNSEVEVSPTPIILTWDCILTRLANIRRRNMLGWAESGLVDDFFEFVDANFKFLNPYSSFEVCKGDEDLIAKRCSSILEELAPGNVRYHKGFADYISMESGAARRVFLYPGKGAILLGFWPGDTVAQSREFFAAVKTDSFLQLAQSGWIIEPNLHFAYRADNLVRTRSKLSLQEYCEFWKHNQDKIRQFKRNEFEKLFQELRNEGLISDENMSELTKQFLESKRDRVNVCPGFELTFKWLMNSAERIDAMGNFSHEVKVKMQEAMHSWGQTFSYASAPASATSA